MCLFLTHVQPRMLGIRGKRCQLLFLRVAPDVLGEITASHRSRTRRGMKAAVVFPGGPGRACAGNFD